MNFVVCIFLDHIVSSTYWSVVSLPSRVVKSGEPCTSGSMVAIKKLFLLLWSCLMELSLVWWIKCYWMKLTWKFVASCWLPRFQQCIPVLFFSTAILGPFFSLWDLCVSPSHFLAFNHTTSLCPCWQCIVICLPPYRCHTGLKNI